MVATREEIKEKIFTKYTGTVGVKTQWNVFYSNNIDRLVSMLNDPFYQSSSYRYEFLGITKSDDPKLGYDGSPYNLAFVFEEHDQRSNKRTVKWFHYSYNDLFLLMYSTIGKMRNFTQAEQDATTKTVLDIIKKNFNVNLSYNDHISAYLTDAENAGYYNNLMGKVKNN